MSDETDDKGQEKRDEAIESLAAATAIGLAVASRSMEMWFGVMAGFARASREMMTPHVETPKHQAPAGDVGREKRAEPEVIDLSTRRRKAAPKVPEKADVKVAPQKRAPVAARSGKADDLKRISGIGPKLEQVLNGLGIETYAQIAALQPDDVARIDDSLGLNGRIESDKWLEQANALAQAGEAKRDVVAG